MSVGVRAYFSPKFTGPYYEAVGDMVAGATEIIPRGRILTGVFSSDADAPNLVVEIDIFGAWTSISFMEGTVWAATVSVITQVNHLVSDGATLRIRNGHGANQVDAVYYTYELFG